MGVWDLLHDYEPSFGPSFEALVQAQPQLKNCRQDRNFILRFLRTNKYNIDKSCRMLERYLKMRTDHPKWFQNLDIEVTQ